MLGLEIRLDQQAEQSVLNLLSDFKERKKSVIRLRLASNFVKESLMFTSSELEVVNPSGILKITPIDLNIFRESISSTEWLLSDQNQMGGHINNKFDSYQSGIYTNLRKLESLNILILPLLTLYSCSRCWPFTKLQ